MEGHLWSVCYFLIISFCASPNDLEGEGQVWFGFSEEETHGKDMFGKIRNVVFGATCHGVVAPRGA